MARAWLTMLAKSTFISNISRPYPLSASFLNRTIKTSTNVCKDEYEPEEFDPSELEDVDPTEVENVSGNPRLEENDPQEKNMFDEDEFLEQPMTYYFTKLKPDVTACLLSDDAKENIWSLHKSDPEHWSIDKLAEEYRIRKQRVHAIIWLKDIEREEEKKNGGPLDDTIQKKFESFFGSYPKGAGERHVKMYFSNPEGLDEESEEYKTKLLEASDKEEVYKVQEFVQRMEYNKQKMAGLVLVNKRDRRRPKEGWSYVVEDLSESAKRGKGGGRKFIANSKGEHRDLNDFEKTFLQREKVIPRRRLVPR